MQELDWLFVSFNELTSQQLYSVLQLRTEVFVIEQDCVYQDMDDNDQQAHHLLGYLGEDIICYARLLAPGIKYKEASIGRIISKLSVRRAGYGKQLVRRAIGCCLETWPKRGVRISAQERLKAFYQDFDFVSVSEPYLEDGIPHVEMLLNST